MPLTIPPVAVDATALATQTRGVGTLERPDATAFTRALGEAIDGVATIEKQADAAAVELTNGLSGDTHGTMVLLSQADISLRFAANVRNRAIEAYREVMRMGA